MAPMVLRVERAAHVAATVRESLRMIGKTPWNCGDLDELITSAAGWLNLPDDSFSIRTAKRLVLTEWEEVEVPVRCTLTDLPVNVCACEACHV
jgi:hypothetical protein